MPEIIDFPKQREPLLLVATPHRDLGYWQFFRYLLKFCVNLPIDSMWRDKAKCWTDLARNSIIEESWETPWTHVLFIDDDMVGFEAEDAVKLLSLDKDIVTGLCFLRDGKNSPAIYSWDAENEAYRPITQVSGKGLVEIDACGMAFTMIKREVFVKVAKPWFENRLTASVMGHDLRFCSSAKASGFKIFCDTSVEIGHLSPTAVDHTIYEMKNGIKFYQEKA